MLRVFVDLIVWISPWKLICRIKFPHENFPRPADFICYTADRYYASEGGDSPHSLPLVPSKATT